MSNPEAELKRYYSRRAHEYDAIYDKPERQRDLTALERRVSSELAGRDVLEIACGTGHWTQRIAGSARSVLATDASRRMLELAGRRTYRGAQVAFRQADAFGLEAIDGQRFNGCFAGFWWSHVPRTRLNAFLGGLLTRLEPGSRCVLVDNRYVPGKSTPIAATDPAGNTYQDRRLMNGSTYRVLKNFPLEAELRGCVTGFADRLELTELEYFWCLAFDIRPCPGADPDPDPGGDGLGRSVIGPE